MKFAKFKSMTKKLHRLEVVQIPDEGLQFLNNGYVVYPVHTLPPLNDEMVFALLDISTEQEREKVHITYVDGIVFNYDDYDPNEEPLRAASVMIDGCVPVMTSAGLYYYNPAWLSSFDGTDFQMMVRYRLGEEERRFPYIAIKRGMLAVGFVVLRDFNADLSPAQKKSIMDLCSMLEVGNA